MNTRIPSLFDDEDFFPQELPKKKTEKKPKVSEPKVDARIEETEDLKNDEVKTNVAEEEIKSAVEEIKASDDVQVDNQDIATPVLVADEDIEQLATIEEDLDLKESEKELAIKAADEELNKQILSELIQVDYAALIHKDYPFDINNASVIKKEQPAAAEPVTTVAIETDELEEEETFEEVTPLPEWNLDKNYYSIGEVAQLFNVNTSHIRFWTTEFKLKPRTTRKGDRLYNPKDIAELRLIHHLVKEKKHTIKGAREKIKAGKDNVNSKLDLKESLLNLKNMLAQIKDQL